MAVKTGIEVYGKSFGLGVIGKMAGEAKKAKEEVTALKAASAGLSGALSGANQGLELAKKGLAVLAAAYASTAGRALELRAANDPARRDIEATAKAAGDAAAALGDAMLPGVQAVSQALLPLVQQLSSWLKTNRDVIATDIGGWMQNAARTGAQVLGVALLGVSKAFYGVLFVVDLVKVGVHEAFGAISTGSAVALNAAAALADRVGKTEVAKGLRATAAAATGLGAEFARSSDAAGAKLQENVNELKAIERAVEAAGAAVDKALSGVAVKAATNLRNAVVRTGEAVRTLAMGWADVAAQLRIVAAESAKRSLSDAARDMYKSTGALTEQQYRYGIATAKAAETEQARVDGMRDLRREYGSAADDAVKSTGSIAAASEMLAQRRTDFGAYADAARSMAQVVASGLADTVIAIASGTMDAGQALAKFVGDTIKNLGTLLVQLGTAALLANALSAIPIFAGLVGPPGVGVGVAAAAIAGGAALIAAGSAIGMAEGGMVRGPSVNGTDSVFANLAPGELVVPYPEVQRNVREGRAPGDSGAPRAGEGGGINVHVTQQSLVPANDAAWRRTVERSVIPIVQEALRTGRLRLA